MKKDKFNKLNEFAPGIKPKLLPARRGLKPVRNLAKKGLLLAYLAGMVFVGGEVIRETVEEVSGQNNIVNIGPIVFKNKETRNAEELYSDIENAILNMEGIEKIFTKENVSLEEREELLQSIIDTMSKEANIATNDYMSVDIPGIGVKGAYANLNLKYISIGTNKIFVNKADLERGSFYDIAEKVIHEMLHAVYFENNLMSDQLTDFDKTLTNIPELIDSRTYYSAFVETNVHLLTSKIMLALKDKYNPNMYFYTFDKTTDVFGEIIENLYDISIDRPDVLSNLFEDKDSETINYIQAESNYEKDVNNYKSKTLEELFMLGYEKKLQDQNINYEDINLKETYYYQMGMYIIKDIKDVRYCDYANSNYNVVIDDVEKQIESFENKVDNLKEYKIAVELGKYSSAMRYATRDYTEEEITLMNNTIYKYLDKLSEKNIIRFGFVEEYKNLQLQAKTANNTVDNEYELEF